jgi:hypothetical protein
LIKPKAGAKYKREGENSETHELPPAVVAAGSLLDIQADEQFVLFSIGDRAGVFFIELFGGDWNAVFVNMRAIRNEKLELFLFFVLHGNYVIAIVDEHQFSDKLFRFAFCRQILGCGLVLDEIGFRINSVEAKNWKQDGNNEQDGSHRLSFFSKH